MGLPYKDTAKKIEEKASRAAAGTLRWLVDEYERRNRSRVSSDLMDRRYRMLIEICASKQGKVDRGTLPYQ